MLHAWSVSRRLKKIGQAAGPRAEFARALETRFGLAPSRPTLRPWMFVASGAFAVLLLAVLVSRPDQPATPTQLLTAQPEQATEREAEKVAQVSDQPLSITEAGAISADQEELDAFFAEFLDSELTVEELEAFEAEPLDDPSDVILEESLDTEAILS